MNIEKISINNGQLMYEMTHLKKKLQHRSPEKLNLITDITTPETHPLFYIVDGGVADWEVI